MNRRALPTGLLTGLSLLLTFSACQPAAPDTNRDASKTTNANVAKETVDKAAVETELLRLEHEWGDAAKAHNAEIVKRLLADDVLMTYPDGTTGTKADEVRDTESGALTLESYELTDPKVIVLDADAALVTGRTTYKNGKYKGPDGKVIDISGDYRFTDVYARRNGNWQVVASQATRIDNPTPIAPSAKPSTGTAGSPPAPAKVSPAPKSTP